MTPEARTERLHVAIEKAQQAGLIADNKLFADVFDALEAELIGRLLACDAEANEARWRLQSAINVGRGIRRAVLNQAASLEALSKELDMIEGRKLRPIA